MSDRLAEVVDRVKEMTTEELRLAAAAVKHQLLLKKRGISHKEACDQLLESMEKGIFESVEPYTREEINER